MIKKLVTIIIKVSNFKKNKHEIKGGLIKKNPQIKSIEIIE